MESELNHDQPLVSHYNQTAGYQIGVFFSLLYPQNAGAYGGSSPWTPNKAIAHALLGA